jgi:hypothetical protein
MTYSIRGGFGGEEAVVVGELASASNADKGI